MILLIDNYDSFTHNLYHLIGKHYGHIQIVRNDQIDLEQIEKLPVKAIVLSPGPKRPEDAGVCLDVIKKFSPTIPLLGVCLGHQAIGMAFGGEVVVAREILHGKQSPIFHTRKRLFKGVKLPFLAGRYHSLIIEKKSLPECLQIEAETENGVIMGVKHRLYPCFGLQFHPESILTTEGEKMIGNFLTEAGLC